MLNLLVIGLGGFLGAIFRVLFSSFATKIAPQSPTLGTLLVNVLGSFLIGALFAYAQNKGISPLFKSFASTGFFGRIDDIFNFFV